MLKNGILAMLVLSLSLVVVGCGDDDGEAASAPGSVQAAVRAIQNGAADDLASQAQFTSIGCTTADGLGGPPKCEPGQANGSMVEVLAMASCEGSYLKRVKKVPPSPPSWTAM